MRSTKTVELPDSGMKVEIIGSWTYGEYKRLENSKARAAKSFRIIDGEQHYDLDHDNPAMMNRLAFDMAILKITDKDGAELAYTYEFIEGLGMDDGLLLQKAINEIGAGTEKK